MSDRTKLGAGPGDKWFAVDAARIMRLPERLRVLWPRELMPGARITRSAVTAPSAPSGVMSGNSAVRGTAIRETVMLGEPAEGSSRRGLDVLTAWLAGFTAELNLTRSRITIVISSGVETAHLEVSLRDDICLAILVLHGEGFEEFADFQLLRRLRPQDLAQVTEELCSLIEKDCVLTLTYLDESKVAGMEFLHRVEGVWSRPTLEREGEAITVGAEHKLGGNAVRLLLASTMARLQTAVFSRPPMTGIQP
ncbi:hypothetical protein [Brevibacterium aurantiacum]|uniref:hypothetical protein n=1 Tax=Brevibacterium aurantiacum TaxID=273384 RepID=UPI000050FA22|nr:hypothetical protein [Brevibacterium aurantiacum]